MTLGWVPWFLFLHQIHKDLFSLPYQGGISTIFWTPKLKPFFPKHLLSVNRPLHSPLKDTSVNCSVIITVHLSIVTDHSIPIIINKYWNLLRARHRSLYFTDNLYQNSKGKSDYHSHFLDKKTEAQKNWAAQSDTGSAGAGTRTQAVCCRALLLIYLPFHTCSGSLTSFKRQKSSKYEPSSCELSKMWMSTACHQHRAWVKSQLALLSYCWRSLISTIFLLQSVTLLAYSIDTCPCMSAVLLAYCTFQGTVRLKVFYFLFVFYVLFVWKVL